MNDRAQQYKRDFWSKENLKFSQPWYRLEKSARIINRLAGGKDRTLLDVGCGPATLMRLLPPNVRYHGIDIALHEPAPNLIEADFTELPISFYGQQFDIIIAQGVFEYVGELQDQKLGELARLLNAGGTFIATYTNFSHRRPRLYEPYSNIRSIDDFRHHLTRYFNIRRSFPASHNWSHSQPSRELIKAMNMPLNVNIPVISPMLAVEYYFICSQHGSR